MDSSNYSGQPHWSDPSHRSGQPHGLSPHRSKQFHSAGTLTVDDIISFTFLGLDINVDNY